MIRNAAHGRPLVQCRSLFLSASVPVPWTPSLHPQKTSHKNHPDDKKGYSLCTVPLSSRTAASWVSFLYSSSNLYAPKVFSSSLRFASFSSPTYLRTQKHRCNFSTKHANLQEFREKFSNRKNGALFVYAPPVIFLILLFSQILSQFQAGPHIRHLQPPTESR